MIEFILIIGFIVLAYFLSKITLYLKTILIDFQTYSDNQRVANAFLTANMEEELILRAKKGEKRAKDILDLIDEIILKRQDNNQRGVF